MIIQNEAGEDIEVFTAEEVAQQAAQKAAEIEEQYKKELAEKDSHYTQKLDEFSKAKKGIDSKESELEQKLSETDRIAREAYERMTKSETEKVEGIKSMAIKNLVGNDSELSKKLLETYELINLPGTSVEEIEARMQMAAGAIGITNASVSPSMNFGGAIAPNFSPASDTKASQSYEQWKKDLGL